MTTYDWRGPFTNAEVTSLHAEAFTTKSSRDVRDWAAQLSEHSLGWVVARQGETLVGFVNVIWDGRQHAWIQDVMVASVARRSGVGTRLVAASREAATAAGCEYLHVDFEPDLQSFYIEACGFAPTTAGLMRLQDR